MEGQSPYSARVGSSYATHCEERGREATMAFDPSGLTNTEQTLWSEAEDGRWGTRHAASSTAETVAGLGSYSGINSSGSRPVEQHWG
jgi:hypothetical protein